MLVKTNYFRLLIFFAFFCWFFLVPSETEAKKVPMYQGTVATFTQEDAGGVYVPYFTRSDGQGNYYFGGSFNGTSDLCPGDGVQYFTSAGGISDYDGYVTKVASNGSCDIKIISGTGSQEVWDFVLDKYGNKYFVSSFRNTVDFDSTSGVDSKTSNGSDDIAITKYLVDGSYAWTLKIGGTGSDKPFVIDTDLSENIYISGSFSSTVDFDPSSGVDNKLSNGNWDVFVTKLTLDGQYVWTQTFGGNAEDRGFLSVDPNKSNVYIGGIFRNTVDFDFTSGTDIKVSGAANGYTDGFLMKMGVDGSYIWTKTIGGPLGDDMTKPVFDSQHNLYVSGSFASTADFDPGPGTDARTSSGSFDYFFSKYSPSGEYIWTKTIGNSSYNSNFYGYRPSIVDNDKFVISGIFSGSMDFDPNEGVVSKTGTGFVAVYNKDGGFEWVHTISGGWFSMGITAAHNNGFIFPTNFGGTVNFNPGGGNDYVTGNYDYGDVSISYFTFSHDTTEVGQTPRSQDPNARPDFVKPITAGPNRVGTPNWVVGSESSNVAKAYLGNDVYKDDVNLTISSATQLDLQNTKPKRIPFPWEQGLNTASDIFWNFNIASAFNGYPIPNLTKPGTLTLTYDPSKLYGKSPSSLKIAQFNPAKNKWTLLPKPTLDATNHTLTTQFTLPGLYAVVYGR